MRQAWLFVTLFALFAMTQAFNFEGLHIDGINEYLHHNEKRQASGTGGNSVASSTAAPATSSAAAASSAAPAHATDSRALAGPGVRRAPAPARAGLPARAAA